MKHVIQVWRETQGLSVRQAAALAGVPVSQWSRLERNLHSPTLDTVDRIARATGIRRDEWPTRIDE